jgi:hypothetical protein
MATLTQNSPAQTSKVPQEYAGEGGKLGEMASKRWEKYLVPLNSVKNVVILVNPGLNLYAPFDLEVGKPSPLGLFVKSEFETSPGNLPEGKHAAEFMDKHNRTLLLGRLIFQDAEGGLYRDIDLKGIGAIFNEGRGKEAQIFQPGADKRTFFPSAMMKNTGIMDKEVALYDYKMNEKLIKAGIRTCRVLAIIELQEIFARESKYDDVVDKTDPPRKISLEEAVKKGIIRKDFHPVIEVRAFGTRARIQNILYDENNELRIKNYGMETEDYGRPLSSDAYAKLMLEDAKKLVSQELGLKKIMSNADYLEWFAKTLGHNLGLLHKNGWMHNYIHAGHNITLDCRLVDFDSVTQAKKEPRPYGFYQTPVGDELDFTRDVLQKFIPTVMDWGNPKITSVDEKRQEIYRLVDKLTEIFDKSYSAVYPYPKE